MKESVKLSKKFMSVLLSALMVLSTISCLGMVSFAEDTNMDERTYSFDYFDINFAGYNGEYTAITVNNIVFKGYNGAIIYVNNGQLFFDRQGESGYYSVSVTDGYDIKYVSTRTGSFEGEGWEYSDLNGCIEWNEGLEKTNIVYFNRSNSFIDTINVICYHEHSCVIKNMGDGSHSFKCTSCGEYSEEVNHTYVNHVCECGAKEQKVYSEIFELNGQITASTENFALTAGDVDDIGWYGDSDNNLIISSKTDNITITAIDAVVGFYGLFYNDVIYSSGEKKETCSVENDSVVHVYDIDSEKLEVVSGHIFLKDITVYYIIDDEIIHHFTGTAKDNGDGTHSYKCTGCDEYSEAVSHTYVNHICECGADDTAILLAQAKEDAIAELKTYNNDLTSDIVYAAISEIKNAESIAEVDSIKAQALEDIANAVERERILQEAIAEAIAEVRAAAEKVADEIDPDGVEYMCLYLATVTSLEELEEAKTEALDTLAAILELKNARLSAIAEINRFKSEANAEIAEKAIEDINNAETVADVAAIHQKALQNMSAADEAAAIAAAKENAIAEITAAAEAAGNTAAMQKVVSDAKERINAANEITVINYIVSDSKEQIKIIAVRPEGAPAGETLDEADCTDHPGEAHVYSFGALQESEDGQYVYGIVYDPMYEDESIIYAPLDASLFTDGYEEGWYLLDYDTYTIVPCDGHMSAQELLAKAIENAIAELTAAAEALNNVPAALAVLEYYSKVINETDFIPQIERLKNEALEQFEEIAERPEGAPNGLDYEESTCLLHPDEYHFYSYGITVTDGGETFVKGLGYDPEFEQVYYAAGSLEYFPEGYAQGWYLLDNETQLAYPCDGHDPEAVLVKVKADAIEQLIEVAEDVQSSLEKRSERIDTIVATAKTDINNAESIYEIGNIIYDAFDAVKFVGEVEISLQLVNSIYADGISGDEIFDEIYESGVEAIESAETYEELDDAYFTTVFDLSKRYYVVVLEKLKADSVTDAAKTIVENALEGINSTELDVETVFDIIAEMDAVAFSAACDASREDINAARTNASYAIAEKALNDIEKEAANEEPDIEAVIAVRETALADMKKADEDAAYAKALTEAKDEALEAVEAALNSAISDEAQAVSIYDIFNAATLEEVASEKEAALGAIARAEKELADAKTAAINAVNAEAGDNASEAVKAIVSDAVKTIDAQKSVSKVDAAKDEAIEAVKAQKEAEKPVPEDPTKICDHMCHKSGFLGFIWKIANFFNKLFKTNKTCSCGVKHY